MSLIVNEDRAYENAGEALPAEPAPGSFSDIDLHFARLMERLSGSENPELFAASALVSAYTRQGHICIDLAFHAGRTLFEKGGSGTVLHCPSLDVWRRSLASSSVVGVPGEYKPMVLDGESRLYLWRYWNYEWTLSRALLSLSRREIAFDAASVKELLSLYFPPEDGDEVDWQKVAVLIALKSPLSILTGGPGTGKTTVVSRILALLLRQNPKLRIALAAPTGKAAQRLEEAVGKSVMALEGTGSASVGGAFRASTIHRLLGMVPGRSRIRYSDENPLPYDVVVVDEASMTPLSLAARLVRALKPDARLILVGDRNQLASVEPGHVLGDICGTGPDHGYSEKTCTLIREATGYHLSPGRPSGVDDCIVELRRTYRFTEESGIRRLSEAVRRGDVEGCMETVRQIRLGDVTVREIGRPDSLRQALKQAVLEGYSPFLQAADIGERFDLLSRFRVLCALREGPYGVNAVNSLIEGILAEEGLIRPGRLHYHGRPVLVTSNDYALRLFNGDVGIILEDEEDGELKCFFQVAGSSPRKISPLRLPEHETAFAMTVHKSQGSEFAKVVLLLPPKDSPVLCRELIYTGITRAMEHLELWMTPEVFSRAASRSNERVSGLAGLLRKEDSPVSVVSEPYAGIPADTVL